MAAPKRTSSQITDNRRVIATLYLQGITQVEIGKRLGMSQPMVSYDLAAIQRVWAQHTAFDLDAAKRKELARIDVLERTYWEAWEDSKGQHEVTTTQIDEWEVPTKGHKTASIRREQLNGNPAYLAGVMACIEKRCKLLGLDLKEPTPGGSPDNPLWLGNATEALTQKLQRIVDGESRLVDPPVLEPGNNGTKPD